MLWRHFRARGERVWRRKEQFREQEYRLFDFVGYLRFEQRFEVR